LIIVRKAVRKVSSKGFRQKTEITELLFRSLAGGYSLAF
jgi:hypothetical protein